MLKRHFYLITALTALALCATHPVGAQEILTAAKYFDTISQNYAHVDDYQAHIVITQGDATMRGTIYYKKPSFMRIDFTDPQDQVIVTNGETLTIYIPKQSAVFQQTLQKGASTGAGGGANLANAQGLELLKRNYSIAYLESPDAVPIDPGSSEKVVKLKLEWRSTDEGFRQLELDIAASGLIRRIVGITPSYEKIQFDFTDIKTNQNIPAGRFRYDPPQTANIYPNFLFVPES